MRVHVSSHAVTVLLLLLLGVSACTDDGADAGHTTSATTATTGTSPVVTTTAAAATTGPAAAASSEAPTSAATATGDPVAEQARFDAALVDLGVDRTTAPADAVELRGAAFCGADDATLGHGEPILDVVGRRCFLDAHAAGDAAVFVTLVSTNEGDPMAFVFRAEGRAVTFWIDRTRDPLSAGGWDGGPCGDLTVSTVAPDNTTPVFGCIG